MLGSQIQINRSQASQHGVRTFHDFISQMHHVSYISLLLCPNTGTNYKTLTLKFLTHNPKLHGQKQFLDFFLIQTGQNKPAYRIHGRQCRFKICQFRRRRRFSRLLDWDGYNRYIATWMVEVYGQLVGVNIYILYIRYIYIRIYYKHIQNIHDTSCMDPMWIEFQINHIIS